MAFLSVNRNGKLALAIMKKWKNGCHVMENHHTEKFPITTPQSLGLLHFSGCQWQWKMGTGNYEKMQFAETRCTESFQLRKVIHLEC